MSLPNSIAYHNSAAPALMASLLSCTMIQIFSNEHYWSVPCIAKIDNLSFLNVNFLLTDNNLNAKSDQSAVHSASYVGFPV